MKNSGYDIGIIGAMESEVAILKERIKYRRTKMVSGIEFYTGYIFDKRVVLARCGIGKVFAAICAEAMILNFNPGIIINTGVGGAIKHGLSVADIVVSEKLVQHDMDTSPLGDPKGLVSGINIIYFEADKRAVEVVLDAARVLGLNAKRGTVASGDRFIATSEEKTRIAEEFDASVCEMEGAAIAHAAYVNGTPFCVIRAISDSADEGSSMDYMEFLPLAAKNSSDITLEFCKRF